MIEAAAAVEAIDPDASDEAIAATVADYLLTMYPAPTYYLSVFHDARPSTARRIERLRKQLRQPNYQPGQPFGDCPLPFDWQHKNIVGISTRDRARARQWCINAMLAGYGVFSSHTRGGSGAGQGTLAQIRHRIRQQWSTERA
jgi:hypothetical protein